MKKSILFFGLGNMGRPMAKRLLSGGHNVQAFDLNLEAKEDFQQSGGGWLNDFKEAGDRDLIFSMLPGGPEMKKLYLEEQKLFSYLKKGALVLDCSTADPQTVCAIHKEAEKNSLRFLSIPVSGGTKGAKEGTLTFMAGGKKEDLKEAEPFLRLMGKNIFHAGGPGAGQAVKICNNMLLAIHMIGTCEALALGQALGLRLEILNQIMRSSSGNNWSLEKYNPCPGLMESAPSSRGYKGGFSVRLMLKDLALAKNSIERTNCPAKLGPKAFEIYKKHFEEGYADKDFSHIFKTISKK